MVTDYIVCMTSYPARMANLPAVVASLRKQTIPPREIWLTVAENEMPQMQPFLDLFNSIRYVYENTRVWKKFLPALEYFKPDQLIMTADDDLLYIPTTAEAMLYRHEQTGDLISGNHYWHNGFKCHCGGCSLVFPKAFAGWKKYYGKWQELRSSDMFLTMLAAKNGYRYSATQSNYINAATPYNPCNPYTASGQVQDTYEKTLKLFGWI